MQRQLWCVVVIVIVVHSFIFVFGFFVVRAGERRRRRRVFAFGWLGERRGRGWRMESVQSALDGCLYFGPGVADVGGVVGTRRATRREAKRGVDEFWIGTVRAASGYLWGDGIIWEGGEKGVEVFVGLA
jgi:hypothetical protein